MVDDSIIAYRLEQVEKAVIDSKTSNEEQNKRIQEKLDQFLELKETIGLIQLRMKSLEKSRDRLIGAVTVVATGVVMLFINMVMSR